MADMFINIDLDTVRSDNAYSDSMRRVKLAITRGVKRGMMELAELMTFEMDSQLASMGLSGTNLEGTISIQEETDGVRINVGADYALYVEYGTGIVGASSPHPDPQNWQYDSQGHGAKGWKYKNRRTGRGGRTRGQVAHPFIYNTYQYGLQISERVIQRNIEREIMKTMARMK